MFVEEHLQKSLTSTQNENLKTIVNKQKCKITCNVKMLYLYFCKINDSNNRQKIIRLRSPKR